RRNTPCAAGCCGPKFMVKFWISGIAGALLETGYKLVILADHFGHQGAWLYGNGLINHPPLLRIVTYFHIAAQREILAEGVTDKAVIRQNAAQIRMPVEQHAIQIESFPFKPVGAVPDIVYR